MKKLFLLLLTILSFPIQAQSLGNEWIDYEKTYFKIKIVREGIYRINYEQLLATNLPLSGKDFQLYRDGKQVPIYPSTTGTFGNRDYIEFFGQANDGTFDTNLYKDSTHQAHTFLSLFTDTATYFLTSATNEENKRFVTVENYIEEVNEAKEYCWVTKRKVYHNNYASGKGTTFSNLTQNDSSFGENEGFSGLQLSSFSSSISQTLLVPNRYEANHYPKPILTVQVLGLSSDWHIDNNNHFITKVNDIPYVNHVFAGRDRATIKQKVFMNSLQDTTQLTFETKNTFSDQIQISINYVEIQYPRTFSFEGIDELKFELAGSSSQDKYFEIPNLQEKCVVYDIDQHIRLLSKVQGTVTKVNLPNPANQQKQQVYIAKHSAIKSVANLTPITFTNYAADTQQGDYIIITHPSLTAGEVNEIQRYADYRSSEAGGNHQVSIVLVNDLYPQFAYGIDQHPLAIRNFLHFAQKNWSITPKQVLLIGKGTSSRHKYNPTIQAKNLLPSYGDNPSDYSFVATSTHDFTPIMQIGRIPAATATDLKHYLDKVIEHETPIPSCSTDKAWKKKLSYTTTAFSPSSKERFEQYHQGYITTLQQSQLGVQVDTSIHLLETGQAPTHNFIQELNQGISVINSFGNGFSSDGYVHSLYPITEQDNKGKYPIFISHESFTAFDLFNVENNNSLLDDFLFTKDKGFLAMVGKTTFSFEDFQHQYNEAFHQNFFIKHYGQPIGFCIQETIKELYQQPADNEQFNSFNKALSIALEQMAYIGDPAIKLAYYTQPDLAINDSLTFLYDVATNLPIMDTLSAEQDIAIQVTINNLEAISDSFVKLHITLLAEETNSQTIYNQSINIPNFQDILTIPIDSEFFTEVGNYTLLIEVDKENEFVESCEENNQLAINVTQFSSPIIEQKNSEHPQFTVNNITVYPNPVSDQITLLGLPVSSTIYLKSITGQTILTKQVKKSNISMSTKGIAKGLFFIEVNYNNQIWREKLVKQ